MADKVLNEAEAAEEFWDHIARTRTCMLGINAQEQHLQPMTAFAEPDTGLIWFFTSDQADIVRDTLSENAARLVFVAKDHEVYADIFGTLTVDNDRERIERFWNPVVAAWYPGGKNDPSLTLMCFAPHEGQIWVAKTGMLRFAMAIVRANITKTPPKEGGVAQVHFRH
jgi:general stress protein 26